MGQAVWLSDRGIVRVFGADAAALLRGLADKRLLEL